MSKNPIEESQQQGQGIAIGTQGNQDIKMTDGAKGPSEVQEHPEDRSIPNQDRSSATNSQRTGGSSNPDE
ncbi:MAG TPA: hypothetical protein VHK69_06585 [Chitinophagaceae bacterium]|jgi:hypothetical protein|nr:hypothetical protein [Chitinophagaceae bacterium]